MISMQDYKKRVDEAVGFLKERITREPSVVVILGTGLGGFADRMETGLLLPYDQIPHFPQATVKSHQGNLMFGRAGNQDVAVLQGRIHYYEGYSTRELTLPLRVLSQLGAEILVITNAAGGLNPAFSPGTIMIIRDHLNFIGENPLRGENIDAWGPRFPDLSEPYDRQLINVTLQCAKKNRNVQDATGVYAAIQGPSLETAAETRFLRMAGADGVGMSTVPEVIVARHAGMRVLGLSVIANVNDPDNFKPIILDEVIETARNVEPQLHELILEILSSL